MNMFNILGVKSKLKLLRVRKFLDSINEVHSRSLSYVSREFILCKMDDTGRAEQRKERINNLRKSSKCARSAIGAFFIRYIEEDFDYKMLLYKERIGKIINQHCFWENVWWRSIDRYNLIVASIINQRATYSPCKRNLEILSSALKMRVEIDGIYINIHYLIFREDVKWSVKSIALKLISDTLHGVKYIPAVMNFGERISRLNYRNRIGLYMIHGRQQFEGRY
uniref:Uncharacterized protein n=1 Tax=Babesia bovis TaxID=5865 RepID=S6C874_BABBO|nr:hypothetical protein [Babesia bovis]